MHHPFFRRISPSAVIVLILVAAAAAQGWTLLDRRAAAAWRAGVGDEIPALQLEQQGVPLDFAASDLPPCSILLVLSPSCPSCQRLAPRWTREFGPNAAIPVVAVSYSSGADAARFAAGHGFRFPVFATGSEDVGKVAGRLGIPSVPRVVILGEGGRIAAMEDSRYDLARMRKAAGC